MGCGATKDQLAAHAKLMQEYDELRNEFDLLRARHEESEVSWKAREQKNHEQVNLMRFKIEVLVQMLAVEEKKFEQTSKRLEALKWAMLTQGFSEKLMSRLLNSSVDFAEKKNLLLSTEMDLSGAIAKMTEEMALSKEAIVGAFADTDGKIVPTMARPEFSKYLFEATESLSKSDVEILSFRFFDGETVSIAEFLEFFTSSAGARRAKSAAAAVRMSINLLQLEAPTQVEDIAPHQSYTMRELEAAMKKLASLWEIVERPIIIAFEDVKPAKGGTIIPVDVFKNILNDICGENGALAVAKRAQKGDKKLVWLNQDDMTILTERFEIGSRIDYQLFLKHFHESIEESALPPTPAHPFRFSTEWSSLRSGALKELSHSVSSFQERLAEVDNQPETTTPAPRPEPTRQTSIRSDPAPMMRSQSEHSLPAQVKKPEPKRPESAPKKAEPPKPTPKETKPEPKPQPKPALKVITDDKKMEAPPKAPSPSPQAPSPAMQEPKSSVYSTLIAKYMEDPAEFSNQLENRSADSAYLFSADDLKEHLREMVSGVSDEELESLVKDIAFPGGTCSAAECVLVLEEWMAAQEKAAEEAAKAPPGPTPTAASPTPMDTNSPISLLQAKIDKLKPNAVRDPITLSYKNNPKEYEKQLKTEAATHNGKEITSDELHNAVALLTPDATEEAIAAFVTSLDGKKAKSGSIPVSAVIAALKAREAEFVKVDKQIVAEEKKLAAEIKKANKPAGGGGCCGGNTTGVHDPSGGGDAPSDPPTTAPASGDAQATDVDDDTSIPTFAHDSPPPPLGKKTSKQAEHKFSRGVSNTTTATSDTLVYSDNSDDKSEHSEPRERRVMSIAESKPDNRRARIAKSRRHDIPTHPRRQTDEYSDLSDDEPFTSMK